MALGLGTRLGEYKSPEVACAYIRRPYSSISDDYNNRNGRSIDMDGTNEYAFKLLTAVVPDIITVTLQFKADAISEHRCLFSFKNWGDVASLYLQ